jgi:hypothetical protein
MNLTEPQAGSDLALVRSRAEPQGDGTYKVFGTKIFITWGEHDMAENIVHLVLARTPNAPEGVKGISLFVVPKFLVNEDGSLGARNDVHCVSIEHKLGIKASPTAVLQFGDHGGAIGYLVGEENRGLEYMFIMMNAARFGVGMQGIGVAERAYQKAVAFAKERVQSRPVDGSAKSVTIIHHPDVRRMLGTMRALTEGARARTWRPRTATSRTAMRRRDAHAPSGDLRILVPIVKGWSTEMVNDVASLGVQVHGGMGFIEETGAAQYYRDGRILHLRRHDGDPGERPGRPQDAARRRCGREGAARGDRRNRRGARQGRRRGRRIDEGAAREGRARAVGGGGLARQCEAGPERGVRGSVPYLKLAGVVLADGRWRVRCSRPTRTARATRRSTARRSRSPNSMRNTCSCRPVRSKRRSSARRATRACSR